MCCRRSSSCSSTGVCGSLILVRAKHSLFGLISVTVLGVCSPIPAAAAAVCGTGYGKDWVICTLCMWGTSLCVLVRIPSQQFASSVHASSVAEIWFAPALSVPLTQAGWFVLVICFTFFSKRKVKYQGCACPEVRAPWRKRSLYQVGLSCTPWSA